MAAPRGVDVHHVPTGADIEQRVARILDPSTEIKTKLIVATEIRERLDTMREVETGRDTETLRVLHLIVPSLIDRLNPEFAAYRKDGLDYQFRTLLFSILSRIPSSEATRQSVYDFMLQVIRRDNEDNAVLAAKHLVELFRINRHIPPESLSQFTDLCRDVFNSVDQLQSNWFTETASVRDPNLALPSVQSFKVATELASVLGLYTQHLKDTIRTGVVLPAAFKFLQFEAPLQKSARENYEAMGNYWSGMAPTIKNASVYSELLLAQIKVLSYLALVMRQQTSSSDVNGEVLVVQSLRILQDCPTHGIALRKELMIVFRHLMTTPHRRALLPQIDKLFDEKVLLGTGLSSNELLRAHVLSAFTDLFHHLRSDLSSAQLEKIVHLYSRQLHNPSLPMNIHIISAKVMFGSAEALITREPTQATARLLEGMLKTCLDRLDALIISHEAILAGLERAKSGNDQPLIDDLLIERARPVFGAAYAAEKPEEVLSAYFLELRLFFKTLLHGFRVCLAGIKKCDQPTPDGTYIFRMFEGCIRCLASFDSDTRMDGDSSMIDWFSPILVEINLHVFQEVWTHKIDFFFDCAQKRVALLGICQFLFSREAQSPTLLAIVLQFLVDRLPMLGEHEDLVVATTIRLYKIAFAAVAAHPTTNESILALHLGKLLMDCFPLAAKATKPTHYFHLLRALFRSIGGGGGRFELLYKEVLPLLPEMLECLNRQLNASVGQTQDMIVELCLTVPLRLTHLLPHLSYLMQPLALALRGGPELVAQGLRTLELCIDNLTPDFLDPTLNLVLRELMEALHSHLKPVPASHAIAHTTIRILGKLGGRNRRLLGREPSLQYIDQSESPKTAISFAGNARKTELGPLIDVACKTLKSKSSVDASYAFTYLEQCVSVTLHEGLNGENAKKMFLEAVQGAFDACHVPQTKEEATQFLRKVAQRIFELETQKTLGPHDPYTRNAPTALLTAFFDAIPHALAREDPVEAEDARLLLSSMIADLVSMMGQTVSLQEITPILHQLSNRFILLCFGDSLVRKTAGCAGIKIMTSTPVVGAAWTTEREIEVIRALLHVLKDLPPDLPRDTNEIVDILTTVLRIGNSSLDYTASGDVARNKLVALTGHFFSELQSSKAIVRQAVQACIDLLVELSGMSITSLLMPHRDRMLVGIYTKPLRALPFAIQIGMIEAIRYCVSLDPPLVEVNDELLRLLHETLALADADDLHARGSARQSGIEITKLHVACIKLLTASMPLTDFFNKQHQTRQRVTGVYFKALYSPSHEIKDVAYDGLKMVLAHQSRLPRELLQTGLRPILMNLADPKRLSVPGLEGLARLLELLVNYFKVEIGHKLLDHFRFVADPQMLQASSKLPLSENEGITKLVRLANIFHLLPSTANIFLDNLINSIVMTEATMCFSGRSPFSEPLARYLDRYPQEGVDFFLKNIHFPRHLRTLRSIIQAKLAPRLESELSSRTHAITNHFLRENNGNLLPALLLLEDLATVDPSWVRQYPHTIRCLVDVWYAPSTVSAAEYIERQSVLLSIFKLILQRDPRIDLVFEIVAIYTRNLEMDLARTTHFLYQLVALSDDIIYRRNILMRFLTWFEDSQYSWSHKAFFLRYVITPTLLVQATRSSTQRLIGADFVNSVQKIIWSRVSDPTRYQDSDDTLKVELLHFTTIMVQHYSDLVEGVKSAVWKFSLSYIHNEDPVVKQTVYLLNAHFCTAIPGNPAKFILKTWSDILRSAHPEGGRGAIRQEALSTLAPALPLTEESASGDHHHYPQWAVTTRRLIYEEGISHAIPVYNLIIKQPDLFYPVRGLFVTHMVGSLQRLGLMGGSTSETRGLSIDILQVIFNWENKAREEQAMKMETDEPSKDVMTPLLYRENMVSYLVRLASSIPESKNNAAAMVVTRSLALLKAIVGPSGWADVAFGLRFFMRALDQNDLDTEATMAAAISSARVLQVICAEQNDQWYFSNAEYLQKLVKKGLVTNENALHDALGPIFDRLLSLMPLPKEEDEQQSDLSEFNLFVYSAIGEALHSNTSVRGPLIMLQSVVKSAPERIESFSIHLLKLLIRLTKDHVQPAKDAPATPTQPDSTVLLIISILDICQTSIAHLADQRRVLLTNLAILAEKSRNPHVCRYILGLARAWALKQEPYPSSKDKANLLNKMGAFESKGSELFNQYLELILEIFSEPSLRRSDLTSRLEPAFLLGCRATDTTLRERFMDLLDASVPRSLFNRLTYICGVQNWETLADNNWIYLALHLLLGAVDTTDASSTRTAATSSVASIPRVKSQSVINSLQRLAYFDAQAAHDTWVSVFPTAWSCLTRREQADITYHMIGLLSKDYHNRQAHVRPNVVETLLAGIHACSPAMTLPPHLVKYLAKTFGCWYVALEILGSSVETVKDDEATVREFVWDSLADVYAELAEEDLFYGVWRKRCLHPDTNVALAFEQNGMWEQASTVYENAQNKTRAGALSYTEAEYCLWEDHWILSAEKLQHWEILNELGRSDSNPEMMLECAWRLKDWTENKQSLEELVSQLPEVPTPRRRVFEAFLALLKSPAALDKNTDFTRVLEDAMQLSLRKWVGLPATLSAAHIPLLQHFQQFVELQEAVQIFGSLSQTTSQNLEKKSQELKMVLQAWRERLPNLHDDISIWSDLVAWRQNVFNAINASYIPLIGGSNQGGNGSAGNANTFGYRGYHETAWIINRFAHVARKHDLLEACFTSLAKIYTLPNIEISEAFLKLREQARCYYQKPNDLQAGLEVINNTNLHYFSASQKAEFFTLKAMFLARSGTGNANGSGPLDASASFGQAAQMDMNQPKVWAEWGRYHDHLYKENGDLTSASSAVSCYLTAAGLYKNGKSRPLLARVLWFLSQDDSHFAISRAFDTYKGEGAFWFWITLIPQLCTSISLREVKQARYILLNLAKHYPQALFFHIRTTREEIHSGRRIATMRAQAQAAAAAAASGDGSVAPTPAPPTEGTLNADGTRSTAWEHVEDIVQLLKTAFPLLILSLETMLDQMLSRFKPAPEEDMYRHMSMLLHDGAQQYLVRMNQSAEDMEMNPQITATLQRLSQSLSGRVKEEFEEDFINTKLNLNDYIQRLQQWRDRYENILDARPRYQTLDNLSHYLTEFQYSKVDEIEVPGQYTEDKDNNQNFVRIQKFHPRFENCRTSGSSWRRIMMIGSDNSSISFCVQHPSHRLYRREEKVMQLCRTFNGALARKKETRKRNLSFHVPVVVSCSPTLRLFQMDTSYVSFSDIFDLHCRSTGIARETPILYSAGKVNKMLREIRSTGVPNQLGKPEYLTMKKTIYDEICTKMVPDDIITKYMIRTMEGPSELWRMRKQFALQIATTSFLTYLLFLGARHPVRFFISRSTGQVVMTEPLPSFNANIPVCSVNDVVPFRLTPNMQHFMGQIFMDGVLTSGIMAIGRSLTEPQFDLEQQLALFCREEVLAWMRPKNMNPDLPQSQFKAHVMTNIDAIVKKAESLACKIEREQALQGFAATQPVMQTVISLICSATNPVQLNKMGEMYQPWF